MAIVNFFQGTRSCPSDERHDPHDERALFCWVCGTELHCEDCGNPVSTHDLFRRSMCPVVRVRTTV
jgi:hypothetical protein